MNASSGRDITTVIAAMQQGDTHASDELLPLVYDELRRLAQQRLSNLPPGQTLEATALVHEAYMRLVSDESGDQWDNRGHFFVAAAESIRRILVESARAKAALKRGGGPQGSRRVEFHEQIAHQRMDPLKLLALNEALDRLESEDPRKASLVKLRHFAGLSTAEASKMLGVSSSTADRWWEYSRLRLFELLDGEGQRDGR